MDRRKFIYVVLVIEVIITAAPEVYFATKPPTVTTLTSTVRGFSSNNTSFNSSQFSPTQRFPVNCNNNRNNYLTRNCNNNKEFSENPKFKE